jgi:transketolase
MRNAYGKAIRQLMQKNEKIILLYADVEVDEYENIREGFPERIFNFGISEANTVAAAAAMAKEGFIPVVLTYNCFLAYRAYEFIRIDVCLQNLNVKMVGLAAGVILNNFGPSHHSTEDISALRALSNLTILSPASVKEVGPVLEKTIDYTGPVYIRLGKAFETEIYKTVPDFEIGRATIIQEGTDITLIGTGSIVADVIEAANLLKKEGISAEIINMSTIKPLDETMVITSAAKTKRVVTVEEHTIYGGLGGAVSECLLKAGVKLDGFDIMGLNDVFCTDYGWHRDLKRGLGLSPEHIMARCIRQMK